MNRTFVFPSDLTIPDDRIISKWVTTAILLLICSAAQAVVRLPAIISDHMVLQRGMPVKIWGWADPGEKVSVSIGGQSAETKAGEDGAWRTSLGELSTGGPLTLTVRGANTVVVKDVLVGEVWLASGQSNMQMAMSSTAGFAEERERANWPQLRMFCTVRKTAREPQKDCEGEWLVCAPGVVGTFSGVAYYFGRDLSRHLRVPVGVIHSSHGGSSIEAWTSQEVLSVKPELKKMLDDWEQKDRSYDPVAAQAEYERALATWKESNQQARKPAARPKAPVHPRDDHHHPAVLFNQMIAPLVGYSLRGAIWYQGESNGHSEESGRLYSVQLPLLIADWRNRWGQGAFPFAWAQLPNYNQAGRWWPFVRESMLKSLAVTNTGMTVNIDLGSTNTIHPPNKRDVGKRFVLWARAQVYGEDVPWSGPLPAGHTLKGRSVELRFQHTDGGLVAKEEDLRGFVISGADRQWKPASARIEGDKVVVISPDVERPVAVRYAWSFNPDGNLFNGAGLPASPFRTDDWP